MCIRDRAGLYLNWPVVFNVLWELAGLYSNWPVLLNDYLLEDGLVSMTGQFKYSLGSPVSHICDSSPHSVKLMTLLVHTWPCRQLHRSHGQGICSCLRGSFCSRKHVALPLSVWQVDRGESLHVHVHIYYKPIYAWLRACAWRYVAPFVCVFSVWLCVMDIVRCLSYNLSRICSQFWGRINQSINVLKPILFCCQPHSLSCIHHNKCTPWCTHT